MKDIKLIVTDMDGTFLNSNYELSPEFPKIYEELKKRSILFVPASGRQMSGITKYFTDFEDEMCFIAENGGYVLCKNEELFADKMEDRFVKEIIETVREIPGAKAVVSGKKHAYYETNDEEFVEFFTQYYTNNKKEEDLTKPLDDGIFKIAVYHPDGSEKHLYPYLKIFQKYGLETVVSGHYWLDIMNKNINKGKALSELQNSLNISPDQTMVFGDYMNDIEMLKSTPYSYAMENAHASVKEVAKFQTSSNDSFGVVATIKGYLESSN